MLLENNDWFLTGYNPLITGYKIKQSFTTVCVILTYNEQLLTTNPKLLSDFSSSDLRRRTSGRTSGEKLLDFSGVALHEAVGGVAPSTPPGCFDLSFASVNTFFISFTLLSSSSTFGCSINTIIIVIINITANYHYQQQQHWCHHHHHQLPHFLGVPSEATTSCHNTKLKPYLDYYYCYYKEICNFSTVMHITISMVYWYCVILHTDNFITYSTLLLLFTFNKISYVLSNVFI